MKTPENTVTAGYEKRIKRMIERGGGQVNLAKAAGVRQSTVSGWLRGAVPYKSVLERMCDALGVNPRWVLFAEEPEELNQEEPNEHALPAHIGHGAVVREDVAPPMMDTTELCAELGAMIAEWPTLSGAFQRMAWERVGTLYSELQRRATAGIDSRRLSRSSASNIYPYPKGISK